MFRNPKLALLIDVSQTKEFLEDFLRHANEDKINFKFNFKIK